MPYMDEWEYLAWIKLKDFQKEEKLPVNDQTDSEEVRS